jgi:protein gp37
MGQKSKIEWTHHTFNPWWGCTKVSQACANCYAETWAHRLGEKIWGVKAPRRFFDDDHWKQPLKWNRIAERNGVRERVFCASMADVLEPREDLNNWRARLWSLIGETPALDWLLLTKRPEQINALVPWKKSWPSNVWIGTTVETQEWARKRIPHILKCPATVRFISCEPLLGPLDLRPWLVSQEGSNAIDWVIAGGESGHGARPTNPMWVKSLRDQCVEVGTAFHFKQWGHWGPQRHPNKPSSKFLELTDSAGSPYRMFAVGKSLAGRRLDGQTWDQIPY